MADLRVHVSAHGGGWRFQWHQDGTAVAGPMDIAAQTANQLGHVGSTIARAFEHRSPDGHSRLPFIPVATLEQTGVQLRELCCQPVAAALADIGTNRLMVVGDVPTALSLPWELLPVGSRGERLGCDKQWGVFRASDQAPLPPPMRRGGPLRILFLAGAPLDQHALDYEKEEEAILRATVTLHGALLFTAELGSYEELADWLQRVKPHIVHLSGHGVLGSDGVGRFCFEDDAGRTDSRTAGDLARLFEARAVPCVFLNGCQTSQAAVAGLCQELTTAGLPLALGWAASVADERATAFVETFYHELLSGEPIPAAAALARLRIQRDGLRQPTASREAEQELTFLLPQLYAARPVEVLFDPQQPREPFHGAATSYQLLPGGVKGLRDGFVGRRREQQQLVPGLRSGDITFLLLHGVGGQGKSTLATRLVDRLRGSGFDVRSVLSRRQPDETAASCAAGAATDIVKEISLAATLAGQERAGALLADESKPLKSRLSLSADVLAQLKCVLVLDNFEDVLEVAPDGQWRIADDGLREFYGRVQTQLTNPDGGRVVATSRYLPAETRDGLADVRVVKGLNDFKDYEFFKLLKRDDAVAWRIRNGEVPLSLLQRLYEFAGGTPRFLERLRSLLRKFKASELEAALEEGGSTLVQERDKYLEDHFGPKLFAILSVEARTLLARLSMSQWPLPVEVLTDLTGVEIAKLEAAIRQSVAFGLLQVFEEGDLPPLYLTYGVWRGWLAERLSDGERTAAHGVLAVSWRAVYQKDRDREMRISMIDGLQACRSHAKAADNRELWLWASVVLSQWWKMIYEWRAARSLLEEIPEAERNDGVWYELATLDANEGNYAKARDKFAKVLAMRQQIGDRQGEAATWHQLATLDVNEGNYAKARDKFAKVLAMRQQIGDRQGEAATWHQLASVDLYEGNYAVARDKFAKVLAMRQEIGDRQGEAATWYQLAQIDLNQGNYVAARDQFAMSLVINQQLGDRQAEAATLERLTHVDLCEGNYAVARDKLAKVLAMRQQIGDRQGEAATWHQLASVDVNEGNYAAARLHFAASMRINQQIGDRPGEAATFIPLGYLAWKEDRHLPAAKFVGLSYLIYEAIGHRYAQRDLQRFLGLCGRLNLTETQIEDLLKEIAASYQRDHGLSLIKEAFFPDSTKSLDEAED